jgi:site-specific DNA-methyltransferase (adenine-specific)
MTEKVAIGDATLYYGDCLEVLPSVKMDALITDPPYSSGGAFRGDRDKDTGKKYLGAHGKPPAVEIDFGGDSRDALGWHYWATLWMSRAFRNSRKGSVAIVFTDWRQLPNASNALQAAGYSWRGLGVWDKQRARPMSGRFMHQAEYFVWGSCGPMPWDFTAEALPGVFSVPAPAAAGREHQTEKPVPLMQSLVKIVPPGHVICDPFMGSGTTGVAAVQMGRKFIGVEMNREYFDIACRRIEQASAQGSLIAPAMREQEQTGLALEP